MSSPRPSIVSDHRSSAPDHGSQIPFGIIIHTTESDPDKPSAIFNFWKNQGLGYWAHAVVTKSGRSGFGANANRKVWATQGANTGRCQIEVCGRAAWKRADWMRPSRRKQLIEVARWCAMWSEQYDIPLRHSTLHGVAGHYDFPQGGHTDPGKGFPLGWVLKRARKMRDAA